MAPPCRLIEWQPKQVVRKRSKPRITGLSGAASAG